MSDWLEKRLPLRAFCHQHLCAYQAPKNLNFWYLFGVFSLVVLANQMITGIWLVMHYTPTAKEAFASIEHMMRYVPFGWLFRYLHAVGASAFFVVVYLHMFRGLLYGSYQKPRELVWLIGCAMFVLLMAEAFTGYVLPWGQMSYWATQVVVSLFSVIPWVGEALATWIRGDYVVSGVTLHRFFSFHVILFPLLIIASVILHICALHTVGSNNPEGIDVQSGPDTRAFHPYYTRKDFFGVSCFLGIFLGFVFLAPELFGLGLEPDNFVPANPLVTPLHIKPVWYFAPFYAMLRAVPSKLLGVLVMKCAVLVLFALPWLDRSPVRSMRYKGRYSQCALAFLVISFTSLGYLGGQAVSTSATWWARFFMLGYFLFFLAMPWITRYECAKRPPEDLRAVS